MAAQLLKFHFSFPSFFSFFLTILCCSSANKKVSHAYRTADNASSTATAVTQFVPKKARIRYCAMFTGLSPEAS